MSSSSSSSPTSSSSSSSPTSSSSSSSSTSLSSAPTDGVVGWWAAARAAGSARRALLVGLNYAGSESALRGCVNDTHNLARVLVEERGFAPHDIVVLADDGSGSAAARGHPLDRAGLTAAVARLAEETHANSVRRVWLSYSGHGAQRRDRSGSESDGQDEGWVCADMRLLSDDTLHGVLARMHRDARVFALFDMCHSGSGLDLDFRLEEGHFKRTARDDRVGAAVVLLSGSKDEQTSADAHLDDRYQGAMTHALLRVLAASDYDLGYAELAGRVRRWLTRHDFEQVPQLTSSRRFRAAARVLVAAD